MNTEYFYCLSCKTLHDNNHNFEYGCCPDCIEKRTPIYVEMEFYLSDDYVSSRSSLFMKEPVFS